MSTGPIDNQVYVNQFYNETMYRDFAVLKLYVNSANPELVDLYRAHVDKHNAQLENNEFPNSGFDLFVPSDVVFDTPFVSRFVDLEIKAEMIYSDLTFTHVSAPNSVSDSGIEYEIDESNIGGISYSTGYYMYPRSSMSKTPLMLANHTGIIDSGYRGNLISALRYIPSKYLPDGFFGPDNGERRPTTITYTLAKHTRLFQICHPNLCPVYVVLVSEDELTSTERGEGGFGSTGIRGVIA